jgi:hypothetical protein
MSTTSKNIPSQNFIPLPIIGIKYFISSNSNFVLVPKILIFSHHNKQPFYKMLHWILYVDRIFELTKQQKIYIKFKTWYIRESVSARIVEKSRKRINKTLVGDSTSQREQSQ